MREYKVLSPSILAADYGRLAEQVQMAQEAGAEWIHLDMMDGMFVPPISFGCDVVSAVGDYTKAALDVHMMMYHPERFFEELSEAGVHMVTVHQETCPHLDRTIYEIKKYHMKAGVALNPSTPVSTLSCILDQIDMVLIMTVNPGFGGQKLIPYTLDKVTEVKQMIGERGLDVSIEVDGGVNFDNIDAVLDAGANIIVSGTSVFRGDIAKNVQDFLSHF